MADQEQDEFAFPDESDFVLDPMQVSQEYDDVSPEIGQLEDDIAQAVEVQFDVDIDNTPETVQAAPEIDEPTATLPYQERQESDLEITDIRNDAVDEYQFQLDRFYREQGLNESQVQEKMKAHADDLFSAAGSGSRLITTDPTHIAFRTHLEVEEIAARNDESVFESALRFIDNEVDPQTMIDARSLMEQGILQETDEAKIRIKELMDEGLTQDDAFEQTIEEFDGQNKEALERRLTDYQKELRDLGLFEVTDNMIENASLAAAVAGGIKFGKSGYKAGSKFGGRFFGGKGAVVGGLGGALVGGSTGAALGGLLVHQGMVGRFNYEPEDGPIEADIPLLRPRQIANYQFSLGQAIYDWMGSPDDLFSYLETRPKEIQAELIARIIHASDVFGVTEKLKEKPSFQKFILSATADPETLDQIIDDPDATDRQKAVATLQKQGLTKPTGPFATSAIVQLLYHPTTRRKIREAYEAVGLKEKEIQGLDFIQDAVGFVVDVGRDEEGNQNRLLAETLADAVKETIGSDAYRETQELGRQKKIDDLKKRQRTEARRKKIDYPEFDLITYIEGVQDGLIDEDEVKKSATYNRFIDAHSYNSAHPDWRGEQPSVEVFSDFAKAALKTGAITEFAEDPLLTEAIQSVKNKEPAETTQKLINEMSLQFLHQLRIGDVQVYKRPTIEAVEKYGEELTGFLQKERGRGASKEAQRALQTLMFEKGFGTLYEPTVFSKILGWAAIIPTAGAETDAVAPEPLIPILKELGLPYGTPAGIDFEEGLGLRPINSSVANRTKARRMSMTGGFQLGFEEIQLARGYSRSDPEFNRYSTVGFILDLLNVEKFLGKGIFTAARIGANTPSAIGATFTSGSPSTKLLLARNQLMANTSFDATVDPIVANHKALKAGAQEDVNNGIDPLSKRMSAADRDLFEDTLRLSGRNPDQVYAAVAAAAQQGNTARKVSEKIKRSIGPNDLYVLRADADYKRLVNDVRNLVRAGKIQAEDAVRFMSLIEAQAIKVAEIPESPFKSAQEVIQNLEVVTNRPAGPGARFMGKGLEEVDTATQDVFSQPLKRDTSADRIRAMLDDVDIEESDSSFKKYLDDKYNKKSLDDLAENERIALKEDLFSGKIPKTPKPAPKPISAAKLNKLKDRYESPSFNGAPGPLNRRVRSTEAYQFKEVPKTTNIKNAAQGFERGDNHRSLLRGRNPIIRNADWNKYWGGITGAKTDKDTGVRQILEPPHKIRAYAEPENMAAELRKLTPEQKRRADTGIELVEELGMLYQTGRAEPRTTAQLLAWTILSRSLSAFPHESAFLDAFLSPPPSSLFRMDFDAFIESAVRGTFDDLTQKQYDVWIGGIHRRRAADDLLAANEITKSEYDFFVGQNEETVQSLLDRKIISQNQADDFLASPRANTKENKVFNGEVVEAMTRSRKLAEGLRKKQSITIDEFNQLVGFHPALRVDGMGNPAAANLRAFGRNFLTKSSERVPEGTTLLGKDGRRFDFSGQTKLEAWHNILLDTSISGQEARRLFHQLYQSSGIDNKVISFMLLAAGRKDVIVIDRIQANHFWGAAENLLGRKVLRKDGSPVDLYEGFPRPSSSKAFEKWANNPRPYSTTRGLADILNGTRGSLLYEAIEDLLSANMDEAYRLAGREGEGSLGRFHWETWVINSGQEVGHDTLNVVLKQAQGFDDPSVGAFVSEGKFQMRRYGMKYAILPMGKDADGVALPPEPRMVVSTKNGENYVFSPETWGQIVDKLQKDGANAQAGLNKPRIVPKGWSLQNEKFANTPWYHRASVDRDNLDIAIRDIGERTTPEQDLALERFAGRAGDGRAKTPRVRESGVDEVEFVESRDYQAFEAAKNQNTRAENLAPKTLEEYEGSRVFMIGSEDAGFVVKNGDLQNVFNNSGIPGLGTEIVKLSIEKYGARTLDCFDGFLPKYYSKAGFEEVARIPFVDEFAPPGWNYFKLGRPDIVIMAYRGGEPGAIRSNYGRFEYKPTNNRTTDFGAAQELARREVRDSGNPRGMEAMGAEPPRRGVGEEPLRSRVGEDKTHDSVEPTVLRLIDPDSTDTKFQRKNGVPLGYFEYDQRTRVAIINLFQKGDLDTLWHENGHFMAALMGEKYKNTLFKLFDHEIDNTGSRNLTDLGHEQFAEAWRYYRRVRDNPNGYLRRLFDELWITLHNFWNGLRRKPGLLPDEVRQYWDLEFGVLAKDRRSVQSAVTGAGFRRPRIMHRTIDTTTGQLGDEAVSQAQQRVAKDLGFDESVIRSLLGDRVTRRVVSRASVQASPGRQRPLTRTVETTYEPRSYDAVDAGLEIYALIKNTDFRKKMMRNSQNTATVGTGRYKVSANILQTLNENVANRYMNALGRPFEELQKQIYQPAEDGLNALARRSTRPAGVVDADIVAFQKRLFSQDPSLDARKQRQSESFVVLDDRAQAGMKVLLREIGNQPESDLIPFMLLDPDANLKLMSVKELNRVRDVLTDITATPHNRRNRNLVDPGLLNRVAEIFIDRNTLDFFGQMLRDTSEFFSKRTPLDKEALDPKAVEILEGGARRLSIGSAEEIMQYANSKRFAPNDTLLNMFSSYVQGSTPRINLANLDALQRIHGRLNGLMKAMDADAAARIDALPATNATKPITRDPIKVGGALDLDFIGRNLPVIQELMDDVLGMTVAERESITVVQSLYDQTKRGRQPSSFTDAERTVLSEAIDIIHIAINEKHQHVKTFAKDIYEISLAVQNVPEGAFLPDYSYTIYRNFYTGKFKDLFAMIDSLQNVRRGQSARRSYNLGILNNIVQVNLQSVANIARRFERSGREVPGIFTKMLGRQQPEYEQRVVSLLVLLKMREVKQQIARQLVEYGFDTSRRRLVGNLDLSSNVSYNRSKYLDRVKFYVDHMLGFTDVGMRTLDEQGKQFGKVLSPESPRTAKADQSGVAGEDRFYGPTERKENFRLDPHIISEMDATAAHEAQTILQRLGIKIGRGTLEVLKLGDREFYLPKNAVDFIEDYTLQNFPRTRIKKTWGEKGRVAYELYGERSNRVVQGISEVAASIAKVGEFLVSPRAFYHGLLIGVGGIPMVGYGMGVFIGGLSQIHLGRGTAAAVKAALDTPAELGEALPLIRRMSQAFREEINFNAGVLARVHGGGAAAPKTKPLILPDGRIITADMMAEALRTHGIKSAFVDVLKNPDLYENLWQRYNKTNPTLSNTVAFGIAGMPEGIVSTILSAALGASFGESTKPGNIFQRAHRVYAETFSAIDTYLRIKVLTGYLKEGRSLEDAAPRVRDVMLDYSAMSDVERNMIARYFAFWSYFSQANKLFFKTVVENPDRVITQLKLIKASQQSILEGKDPDKFLSPWDRYRTVIPFEIDGQRFRLPFLIAGDTMGLVTEGATLMHGLVEDDVPDETVSKAALAISSRLSPQIGLGIATALKIDPGLGFPLDRATLQVPAELVHMDELLFGRAFSDFLEVEYIEPENIRYVFDDKEEGKKRVNPNNIEHPGRGIYVSKAPAKYYYVMNYLQSPVTGRMGDNMWALSRANTGIIESFVDALEYAKVNYSPDRPIMSNFGALNALEFVGIDIPDRDPRRRRTVDDPVTESIELLSTPLDEIEGPMREQDSIRPGEQITTAPINLLKDLGVAVRNEDGSYEVYTDRFYWTELGRVFGFTAMPGGDKVRPVVMDKRAHAKSSAAKAKDLERKIDAGLNAGTLRDLSQSPDDQ